MALLQVKHTRIAGITGTLPSTKVSNSDIQSLSPQEVDLLIKTTGIKERRIANDKTTASDLCLDAAERLIEELNWQKEDIEILVYVTQTPDYIIPGTSMLLQDKLGLPKTCMTLDINQGCAGYVYGLSVISNLLSSGAVKKGLLLVGDTITKLIAKEDNSTHPIFSDAGTATALEFDLNAKDMCFNLQSDGSGYEAIIQPEGGARNPGNGKMQMKGHDVFTFALREVPTNVSETIANANKSKDQIDYFVMHQANKLLNESIRRKLQLPAEKVPYTLSKYGNTSCATIPITLISELRKPMQERTLDLVLSGFGVGLSWGSAVVHVSQIVCPELTEIE